MDRVLEHFLPQWKPVRRVVRQLIDGQIQMIERGGGCRFVDEASVGPHPLTPNAPCCHVGKGEQAVGCLKGCVVLFQDQGGFQILALRPKPRAAVICGQILLQRIHNRAAAVREDRSGHAPI